MRASMPDIMRDSMRDSERDAPVRSGSSGHPVRPILGRVIWWAARPGLEVLLITAYAENADPQAGFGAELWSNRPPVLAASHPAASAAHPMPDFRRRQS